MGKTTLSKKILKTEGEAKYDKNAKEILSEKIVLAHILSGTCQEFKGMNPKDIVPLIEGQPKVSQEPVLPEDEPPEITGLSTEYSEFGTSFNTYDVKFYVWKPDKSECIEEHVKIIVDIEAQDIHNISYSITKRGIFYGARMISAQSDTEFTKSQYDKIKKVYSIWIIFGVAKQYENTITEYNITETNVVGNVSDEKENYDLISIIQIRLGKEIVEAIDKRDWILRFLGVLFDKKMKADEKEKILIKEYDIKMTTSLKGGFENMCNLSYGIKMEGYEEGRIEGKTEGRTEGRAEGRAEGRIEILKRMIEKEYSVDSILEFEYTKEDIDEAKELIVRN